MVGQLVTAGFSALGSIEEGQSEKAIDNANAKTEGINAENAQLVAAANSQDVERSAKRATARAAADFGAAGVEATGSPLSVMHDIATQGELSKRLTLFQGQLQAKGFAQQGAIDRAEGAATMQAAYFTAGTTLLTAADKAAETKWPGFDSFGSG